MSKKSKNRFDISQFIRVEDGVYRVIKKDENGNEITRLSQWRYGVFRSDFPNLDERNQLKRYDGFAIVPSHIDFKQTVNNYYNLYSPLKYKPSEGCWETIDSLFRHIFSEQYELGLDYVQLLYLNPKQMLPVLLLVSDSQITGKTTFMNLLNEIFNPNTVACTGENMRDKFNKDMEGKLLVMSDEASFERKEDYERIKYLSTSQYMKVEKKGVDRYDTPSFAKFIFSSNNIYNPFCIQKGDTRFWVREIPSFKKEIPNALDVMKKEIPAFLFFLLHRTLSVPNAQSRLWFNPDDIKTEALERIISFALNPEEREFFEFLSGVMTTYNLEEYCFTVKHLIELMKREGVDIKSSNIKSFLRRRGIAPRNPCSSFKTLIVDENTSNIHLSETIIGRYYSIKTEHIDKIL